MMTDLAVQRGALGRQRFLETVLESAVDYAIIGLDLDGNIIEWTEGARRILGWEPNDMIGRHVSAFFSPEDVADAIPEAELRGARDHGRASDERWHVHKDGTRFYALGEMMPMRDETGTLVGYMKILRDRTRQKLADDALRDREAFLSSVLGSSGDCIKILDLDGRLSFMTETGQKVMEVADFNALCGLSWPTLWQSAERPAAEAAVATARAGGVGHFQGFCPTMKGTPKHWDVVVTPIRGADGNVANLLAVSRDITSVRAAETAREAAETKARFDEGLLAAIFRQAPIGISVADAATGDALMLNDTIKAMLGAMPPENGNAPYRGHGAEHGDGRPYGPEDYPSARVLATGAPVAWEDMLYRRPGEDALRLYEASSAPVHNADGKLIASVTIVVDAEAERAAKAEAAKLAALVEQSSDCITIAALDGRLDYINPAGLAMLDLPDVETARTTDITRHFESECRATIKSQAFPEVALSGHWEGELRLQPVEADRTPVLHTAFPLRDAKGSLIAFGGVTRDLTARKAAEKRQTMLNHELSHRMKNMLAMVQSIAFQTLRSAPSVDVARETLSARIVALSKAHDLLLEGTAEAADMRAIVAAAVAPHDEEGQPRFALEGPDLSVGPRAATALSLMLHELATNAAKYGALSVPDGRIVIAWAVTGAAFTMHWSESGGPPVAPPTKLGFGSRLIERGLAADVGGKVVLAYPPGGVVCTVEAALPVLQRGA